MAVLVGKAAPDFVAPAVMADNSINEKFQFSQHIKGKYAVLFFYPLDFTFVCPSEILAFNHRLNDFKSRNTEVIACSVDSQFTHLAWKNTPEEKGGIGHIKLPMVADLSKSIARNYDVLLNDEVALRGSFLIDREGVVRHEVINDLPLGRNIDEMLRMVDALQFSEEHGEVCPAQWEKGKAGMKPTSEGVADFLAHHGKEL
ncbi:putative peroxiredoxin [Acidithiobacillus ferrivorans]|uniref:Thioredoxin peroxidase n=1 Tax=Acidithiobacillus ferrivorans TaxID=160808 RepID=A0A060ULM4_9PROT|nr:peroxiredoxin [Acidithiobacillus ferrivorans]MBN6739199.1 peroxiredoxin [Acidithiobacillus sp. MC6.1]OCB03779.1 alkyl hydroperoxide reductase [Acidithiobacillus ferrivorans]QQD73948.1 peroxiredoxin [Acidithiobacillus ferrivorans]CDQ09251.1 putative peroxiredoxin [Acidithiobacillus ferrivorans]SMH64923.1 putative peroxiredoxin [Acidithiobacillus ferrivorans]